MKTIVIANWKMNPATFREARKLFEATKKIADSAKSIAIVVAPPALYLRELRGAYMGARISFAAQNACFELGGAHTGGVSLAQIKDARVQYVLVGHAERRAAGETNEDTGKKVAAALAAGLVPIFCVGETKRSGSGEHFLFVKDQLRAGFASVPPAKASRVIVAYEPVWAIGSDAAMSPRDMHEMAIFIRKTVVEVCGESGHKVQILYGGAADETNAADMLRDGDVRGLLVGRASQDAGRFAALIRALGDA